MYPHVVQADDESLQTDVMRFMAIIAFCLIAILTLVKNVEETVVASTPIPAPQVIPDSEPAPAVTQIKLRASPPVPIQPPLPARPIAQDKPETERTFLVRTQENQRRASAQKNAVAENAVAAMQTVPQTKTPVNDLPVTEEKKGLSLRFASERDFLRLISRDTIDLYAFNEARVLMLADQYVFVTATPPGQLYELMPETIPALISSALVSNGDDTKFNWGIRMPAVMEQKIRQFIDQHVAGELIIDRYGDVHHVPQS